MHLEQTRTLTARRAAAQAFSTAFLGSWGSEFGSELTVDDPENGEPFSVSFSPWPVRFFVLQRDQRRQCDPPEAPRVRFVSSPRNGGFIELGPFADALRSAAAKPLAGHWI